MLKKATSLSLLLLCVCVMATAQSRGWHVPIYQGLKLGKSTKADVERAFGKPVWSGHPIYNEPEGEVKDELLYEYQNVGGFDGRTSVYLDARSSAVKAISLYPDYRRPISLEQAVEKYGGGYIERGSKLGPCPTPKEVRVYGGDKEREYPIFLVYPQKGLYVSIDRDKRVQEIGLLVRCPYQQRAAEQRHAPRPRIAGLSCARPGRNHDSSRRVMPGVRPLRAKQAVALLAVELTHTLEGLCDSF
jgi:hypothetical protein